MGALILGNDQSWTGWGWAIKPPKGPLVAGHVARIGGRTWRWDAVRLQLQELRVLVADHEGRMGPGDTVRVALEIAPKVHKRRNQAATARGLGTLAGAVALWGTRPGEWDYPWELEPNPWRAWWVRGRRPKGTPAWKAWSVAVARQLGHGAILDRYKWDPETGGPMGDVADAILITEGAHRNLAQAPKGPSPIHSPDWS